ncbi:dTDP-4-dehydrorhamnose reductase [Thermoflexus sp.]|jgi:dTDP-4-dehydrorhamnose reductase|uniref:dTDP-4-dehydrorhamnose reductase n=1 Tax=Thermoflexus sp. TaxID=1969742 RepID=UPI002630E6D7|nr:dTDP-4-dehydrorhamnose reductase [Thermoflexus sp.]
MRVLLTGGTGMLGRAIREVWGSQPGIELLAPPRVELDLADPPQIFEAVSRIRPEVILHAAAIADVDRCEANPDLAFRVNTVGTACLAAAAQMSGATLIFISTDYVFDGTKGTPYTEFDRPNPINVYGWSKLQAEEYVRTLCPRHFVVRTAWLFAPWGQHFVTHTVERIRKGEPVGGIAQVGSPTFVLDLAQALLRLLEYPAYGLYHIANHGAVSRYEMARTILAMLGRDPEEAVRLSGISGRRAPRPDRSPLRNYVLELQGRDPMRPWTEALAECLERMGLRVRHLSS